MIMKMEYNAQTEQSLKVAHSPGSLQSLAEKLYLSIYLHSKA